MGSRQKKMGYKCQILSPVCNVDLLTYPVESNDIVVTLTSVEFDGETTWVTGSIWELTTDGDSRESKEEGSLAANAGKEVRLLYRLDLSFIST